MPYPNEHAFRIMKPNLFEKQSFRKKTIKPGIIIIVGRLKGKDTTTTQSYRFNKGKFTFEEAKKWIKEHDVKTILQEKATGKEIKAFIRLYSNIQALGQNDIIKKIPSDVLAKIKENDSHPFFQMYSICHEGESTPKIFGANNKVEKSQPISWTKKAIESMANVIKVGVKFFQGHNKTNSDITQKEVGKVIHAFQEEIDGKLHQVVIGYFPEKKAVINNDVCSQEASWTFIEQAGQLIADTCKKITGIALENSKIAEPAFKDAKRLGFVQAFESSGDEQPGEGEKAMTFEEIKQGIKDLNIYPNHIFNEDDLKNDRKFGPLFDKISTLEKENKALDENLKKNNDEFMTLKRSSNLNTAKTRIGKYMQEKSLPKPMQLFIEKSFDEDKENIEDLSDDGLTKYIDKETKIYQRVMKNIDNENISIDTGDGKDIADKEDYATPENNEFLEE
jgi:hypothetical protein